MQLSTDAKPAAYTEVSLLRAVTAFSRKDMASGGCLDVSELLRQHRPSIAIVTEMVRS
jgi:hypothetical protein